MANRISTVIDITVDKATAALRDLKNAVGDANGFMGKLKAGATSLGGTLKTFAGSPAGIAAIGAGVAGAGVAAFEAVDKFSKLGVEVGKFADATGLSAEESSRWIEVAGDIGIESGTVESGIGKMNKVLGATPGAFERAGIAIATTKTGATDVNATFLNTIDRLRGIQDPAKRAALATQLLGKGWQSMAELIQQGSGQLTQSLAAVSEAKTFDDAKVQKARDFRQAMDNLHDVFEDIVIQLGTDLEPALRSTAEAATKFAKAFGWLTDNNPVAGLNGMVRALWDFDEPSKAQIANQEKLAEGLAETDRETRKLMVGFGEIKDAEDEATEAANKYKNNAANTARSVKQNIDEMIGKWDDLKGDVDADKSWLTLQGQFDDLRQKAVDAFTAASTGADDAEQKGRVYQIAIDDIITDTVDYAEKVKGIPAEKLITVRAALDQGEFDRAEAMLAILTRNRTVSFDIIARGGAGYVSLSGAQASGTTNAPRGLNLVGEKGAELVDFGGGETVYNAGQTAAMLNGGGGPSIGEVHIHVQSMPTPNELISIVKRYEARNGSGWRS